MYPLWLGINYGCKINSRWRGKPEIHGQHGVGDMPSVTCLCCPSFLLMGVVRCVLYLWAGREGSGQLSRFLKHRFSADGFSLKHHERFLLSRFIPISIHTCSWKICPHMNKIKPHQRKNKTSNVLWLYKPLQLTPYILFISLFYRKKLLKLWSVFIASQSSHYFFLFRLFQFDFCPNYVSQILFRRSSYFCMLLIYGFSFSYLTSQSYSTQSTIPYSLDTIFLVFVTPPRSLDSQCLIGCSFSDFFFFCDCSIRTLKSGVLQGPVLVLLCLL